VFNPSEHQLSSRPCLEELSSLNLEFSDAPPPPLSAISLHLLLSSLFFYFIYFLFSTSYVFPPLFSTLYFVSAFSSSGSLVTLSYSPIYSHLSLFLSSSSYTALWTLTKIKNSQVFTPLNTEFWNHIPSVCYKYNEQTNQTTERRFVTTTTTVYFITL